MASLSLAFAFVLSLICFPYLLIAQQSYGDSNCPAYNNASTALGYDCNGVNRTCQTFLIYRAQPAYNTISSIASLLSANASEVSAINSNISVSKALATDTEVIVPLTCSCAGRFYQANTSYVVQTNENYYVINTNKFESLTTCNAIQIQKTSPNVINVFPDDKLNIPLRCACPTRKQFDAGIRHLITYVIQSGNAIASIAHRFGADVGQTLEANGKSEQNSVIQPNTTLLVPVQFPPNSSHMDYPPYVPPPPLPPPSIPPRATPSQPLSSGSSSKKWAYFGVGIVVGAAFISVAGTILFCMLLGKLTKKKNDPIVSLRSFEAQEKAVTEKSLETETESLVFLESISKIASLKVYSFKDLQAATENFSADHWIKGSVYKGNVNGDEVVIKKMDGDVSKEINVLNKINHLNLIRLLGVCFQDGIWYFVYEYAGNGPLSDWIYQDSPDKKNLSWGQRMQVAFDVATGLNYLHRYTSPPHVHKDIKSRNVLLTDKFRGKIAKFGLARPVMGNDGQFTLTKHIVGTKGYLAPEYLENGIVSPMLDVYAFGVLLLEMLTGKDVAFLYEGVKVHLSEVLGPLVKEEDGISNLKDFMDTSLGEDYPADIAYTMLVLVDHCLRKDQGKRPSMDEIVQILSKTLTTSLIWGSSTSAGNSSS
ncbi:lysM domain receptor-like kinase 4 [Chenopodium quinoa]|uniref:lysM domain receptor-like kinase 4 n=1 Tax=Chenopodium quinoa TaxID=63459 RepID=UPI000B798E04|nr:lysM domain receptor-like kinase 4 [Chenopodium quinoa]